MADHSRPIGQGRCRICIADDAVDAVNAVDAVDADKSGRKGSKVVKVVKMVENISNAGGYMYPIHDTVQLAPAGAIVDAPLQFIAIFSHNFFTQSLPGLRIF